MIELTWSEATKIGTTRIGRLVTNALETQAVTIEDDPRVNYLR